MGFNKIKELMRSSACAARVHFGKGSVYSGRLSKVEGRDLSVWVGASHSRSSVAHDQL